jgi:hypothetical protein
MTLRLGPIRFETAPPWCSRLSWQLIGFHRYAPSAPRCVSASRARSDCGSTLPQLPGHMAEGWLHER